MRNRGTSRTSLYSRSGVILKSGIGMSAGKLGSALVLVLLFGQMQNAWCSTSQCVRDDFAASGAAQNEQNLPPCHRTHSHGSQHQSSGDNSDHKAPATCAHSALGSAQIAPGGHSVMPAVALLPFADVLPHSTVSIDSSSPMDHFAPPHFSPPATTVLRI